MKKLVSLLLVLPIVFSLSISAFAVGSFDMAINENDHPFGQPDEVEYVECEEGKSLVCENLRAIDNDRKIIAFTQKCLETEKATDGSRISPDREKTAVFSHMIFDGDGIPVATIYVTVTGMYSQVDHSAYLTNISATGTGEWVRYLSWDYSIFGDTGTLYLYFNHLLLLGSFSYKIYTNGSIRNITPIISE